jgi:ribosomal protein S5
MLEEHSHIWGLYRDRVFKEIGNMMGVEDATTNTPGWFQMQMPAIKRVFDSMTEVEKAVLDSEQERMMGEGYPEQTKRR